MYVWIWRHLPGPTAVKWLQALGLFLRGGGAAVLRGVPVARAVPAVRPDVDRLNRTSTETDSATGAESGCARLVGVSTILVVDNYDSFVFNLVQYLEQLGADCIVRRNDAVTTDEIAELGVDGVLLSPGPGTPADAGVTEQIVRWGAGRLPIFGVCLGHQAIAEVYGAVVDRAEELLHGRTSLVAPRRGRRACRVAGSVHRHPLPLAGRGRRHRARRARGHRPHRGRGDHGPAAPRARRSKGVQFHPESVLTQGGHRMLANWLRDLR